MGSETNRSDTMAVGNVAKRGNGRAWWAKEFERLHFDGSIPLEIARELIGWAPLTVPMMYVNPVTGEPTDYPGKQITVRSDTGQAIGASGKVFTPILPWEWFINGPARLLECNPVDLSLGFLGVMQDSAVIAAQVELSQTQSSATGAAFRPFMYAAIAFNGSLKAQYGLAYTRIVCENTFAMAQGEAASSGKLVSMKQTTNARLDDDAARTALDLITQSIDGIDAELRAMCDTPVTDRQWASYVETSVPLTRDGVELAGRSRTMATNKRESLSQLWNSDPRVSPWRGTAFGVSQAATTYDQHMSIVRNVSRVERQKLDMISGATLDAESAALRTLAAILDHDGSACRFTVPAMATV